MRQQEPGPGNRASRSNRTSTHSGAQVEPSAATYHKPSKAGVYLELDEQMEGELRAKLGKVRENRGENSRMREHRMIDTGCVGSL